MRAPNLARVELEHLVYLIDDGRKIEPDKCSLCERLAKSARAALAAVSEPGESQP